MQIRPLLGLLVGLAACVSEPPTELDTVERCAKYFCGGNSPTVGHYGFWELNSFGIPNAQGFELLGLSQGRAFYYPAVIDSRLRARDRRGNELRGSQLVGATIWLRRGTAQYGVVITSVGTFDEVVAPFQTLETYVLEWGDVLAGQLPGRMFPGARVETMPVLGGTTNVCPPPDYTTSGGITEWDHTAAMSPYQTLLYEGDRFDDKGRTVGHVAQDDWFNIGCGAHTLAKLRLTRNTIHTAASWQNVQAAFKMLSADYCGTGRSFTVDGEPLVWRDRGTMVFWQKPLELEARWDENGATCLNSPRLLRSTNPLASLIFSWTALQTECANHPLVKCTERDPNLWQGSELVVSGNYD